MAEWPCCHDPLRFSPLSLRFVPPLSPSLPLLRFFSQGSAGGWKRTLVTFGCSISYVVVIVYIIGLRQLNPICCTYTRNVFGSKTIQPLGVPRAPDRPSGCSAKGHPFPTTFPSLFRGSTSGTRGIVSPRHFPSMACLACHNLTVCFYGCKLALSLTTERSDGRTVIFDDACFDNDERTRNVTECSICC